MQTDTSRLKPWVAEQEAPSAQKMIPNNLSWKRCPNERMLALADEYNVEKMVVHWLLHDTTSF